MTVDEQVEAFRRVAERGFGAGDLTVLDELVDPALVQHERGVSDSNGLDAVKQRVRLLRAGFPDLTATVKDIFGADDRVCARVRWSGTHSGEFAGMPATGRTATWDGYDVARFAGGKVVEHWGLIDQFALMQQLGVLARTREMSENSDQRRPVAVSGLHHVLLTVRDLARSTAFYTDVIGLRVWREIPDDGVAGAKTLFALPDGSMLGVVQHGDGEPGTFDEKRAGLDHVALTVADRDLRQWEQRLRDARVPHSPAAPSAAGDPLIVLRDPDNIQVQIYARHPA